MAISILLAPVNKTLLTSTNLTYIETVKTKGAVNLNVDVVADKGCSVIVEPLIDQNDLTITGAASDIGTISNGGGKGAFLYSNIMADYAKVTVTKTEAGDMTNFVCAIRGYN